MTVSLPPKLYFRIGEVAGLVGVEPHVLRYWEREFRSIRPTKSAKGQRVYSRKDVEALIVVKDLLYAQGFTIAGAKKRLQRTPDPRAQAGTAPAPQSAQPAQAAHSPTGDEVDDQGDEDEASTPSPGGGRAPALSLGRHAEEALLRTLDRPQTPAAPAALAQVALTSVLTSVTVQQTQPEAVVPMQAKRVVPTNGSQRREVEGTRKALISLRAEVEALLSELGG